MSLDAVPSGFSSAAALTLLKTMRSTQSTNSSFMAQPSSSPFDATSRSAVSSDTIFSIIAAASKNQSPTPPASHPTVDHTDQADLDRAQDLDQNDPYRQKSYTIDEAAQNFYAMQNQMADSLRRTGLTQDGQTNGQVIAALLNYTGQKAADFASAFDNKTLTVTDPTTLGLDAQVTRTYIGSPGNVSGETISFSINQDAWSAYSMQHPNTMWTDDQGFKGGGGLMFSW